jgi:hypothetical protein
MSEVKVNKISPRSGTGVQLGDSGDTITIPSGATINNQGTATNFGATGSASWTTTVKTSTFTAVAGEGYFVNTTGGVVSVNLPAGVAGAVVAIKDYAGTFDTNAVTLVQNGSDKIGGSTDNKVLNTEGIAVTLIFIDSTQGWLVTDDGLQNTISAIPYSADFLVVAGGGSGGSGRGGGGGAGGYRTSTQTITAGNAITVTVGDGGASATETDGNTGSNSSISGTGLTTITSAGGGGGGGDGNAEYTGLNGGSGGGAALTGSIGNGNTPSTSPSQGNNGGTGNNSAPNYTAGGGGGANAVGVNGTSTTGGNGGAGTASSITGSSVTRAGGGGGNTYQGGTGGSGGSGGGGGATANSTGTAGTVNTGGGGGGGARTPSYLASGAGGKGVVILSMPDADYSGTTTGSPTVATGVSGKTVLTFTGSGSYTA